jgi:hypothetical protein
LMNQFQIGCLAGWVFIELANCLFSTVVMVFDFLFCV